MEVMDISLARFYPLVFKRGQPMPYDFLGVVSVSVCIFRINFQKEVK